MLNLSALLTGLSLPDAGVSVAAQMAEVCIIKHKQILQLIPFFRVLLVYHWRCVCVQEAAKAFGVSASTISKYAREYGITWRKSTGKFPVLSGVSSST